ncbi:MULTISPECIES: isopentenyl phosphate kinase [Archaeoglobus]|uniref:Isopentenyl phosphate kinase n=1 Tax=Archaeoglobus fulgidus TaxID=2234 RepID=A0A101E0F7_ARCFL|nr:MULTISPECIES: isopentenyl phosphate kinase [Archaeoglobus]KUJ92832.1 MAG: Acetylglutamate kinase, putative [Archaeoglobus fulgidus]KUK06274.1 MAG: Acetylglutamate kinase, putative [Archaeoglobus fulgidus]MDI3497015.1 isopentenyl phosphate kinase [Archaeoglobus sp.]
MKSDVTILKIGGSVITDKSRGAFEKLKERELREVCRAISEKWRNLIVVHGAGSFGHPHVKKFGLSPLGASKVHLGCLRLSERFCSALTEFEVPAYPIHPFLAYSVEIVDKAMKSGFLPVLHGDVVMAEKIEVLSGDDIVAHLAEAFKAEKIGFATDVEGVYDFNGNVIDRLDRSLLEEMIAKGGVAKGKEDVTGGMLRKLQKLYEMGHGCKAYVFKGNYENLKKFLQGEKVGTEVII